MRTLLPAILICAWAGVVCGQLPKADFYVAPGGADTWSGTLATPNADRTDGPFASLSRARDAVRARVRSADSRDLNVLLRGGRYELGETVVFGRADGGTGTHSVSYSAYPGETPVLSAGAVIGPWRQAPDSLTKLPKAARGKVWVAEVDHRFHTLYDAQGPLPRARTAGFVPLAGGSSNRLRCPPGTLKDWPNLQDVEVVIRPHHGWIVNVLPLSSVDVRKQIALTATPGSYPLNEQKYADVTESCWIENVLEALDEPSEWVLNSQTGKLYLWPRDGAKPEGVVAPRLRELIRVEGEVDFKGAVDEPVRNLHFRGLAFMHGDGYRFRKDDAGLQHDWDLYDRDNAMVRLRGTQNCSVDSCHFRDSGGGGVRVDLYGQQNRIVNNHLEHLGGTGILLAGYGPGTKDVNVKNLVANNHVHNVGEVYSHSPGIMIWQSGENHVTNNLIHHVPYTAIIVSGVMADFFGRRGRRELAPTVRWDEIPGKPGNRKREQIVAYLHSHDNLVAYNEIHHAMEKLADGNAIYLRGAGGGNVIRRNYIHHLVAPTVMQAAIRTDGGQRDTLIAENVIYKCRSQGIKLKLNNRAENNFIVDLMNGQHKGKTDHPAAIALREGPMTDAVVHRNVMLHSDANGIFYDQQRGVSRGRPPAPLKDVKIDHNLYWITGNAKRARLALDRHKEDGVDANSLLADPLFVDVAKGDFRFKPDSPALKLGIVPIDVSKCGLAK